MTGYTIGKSSTLDVSFRYTPTEAKVTTVTVTAVVVLDGKEYTFTKTIDLDVLNADRAGLYSASTAPTTTSMWPATIRTHGQLLAISPRSTVCAPCS